MLNQRHNRESVLCTLRQKLGREIRKQEDLFKQYHDEQRIIRFDKICDEAWVAYSEDEPCHRYNDNSGQPEHSKAGMQTRRFHGILPRIKTIVVGMDIREYSRRNHEQHLFLTTHLYASIRRAVSILQETDLLPADEPFMAQQTGDGAYVMFSFLDSHVPLDDKDNYLSAAEQENIKNGQSTGLDAIKAYVLETDPDKKDELRKNAAQACRRLVNKQKEKHRGQVYEVAGWAFSFIFALNAVLAEDNARQRFKDDSQRSRDSFPTFPIECRYAVSFDDVYLLANDLYEEPNCVGNAIVTCARIVSNDHGNHLLVDHNLMRELEPHGGINGLRGGIWKQKLHHSLLSEVKIKSGSFRYADVFGFYNDDPLMQSKRRTNTAGKQIHIGSHDVNTLG